MAASTVSRACLVAQCNEGVAQAIRMVGSTLLGLNRTENRTGALIRCLSREAAAAHLEYPTMGRPVAPAQLRRGEEL